MRPTCFFDELKMILSIKVSSLKEYKHKNDEKNKDKILMWHIVKTHISLDIENVLSQQILSSNLLKSSIIFSNR